VENPRRVIRRNAEGQSSGGRRPTKRLGATLFRGWDLARAPPPAIPDTLCLYMTSKWINMNVLSLDGEPVLVEAQDGPMAALLKRLGFRPIPVPFRHFNAFGGSLHCATCDVRRESTLGATRNSKI
jgi:glycine amidinotransferase